MEIIYVLTNNWAFDGDSGVDLVYASKSMKTLKIEMQKRIESDKEDNSDDLIIEMSEDGMHYEAYAENEWAENHNIYIIDQVDII